MSNTKDNTHNDIVSSTSISLGKKELQDLFQECLSYSARYMTWYRRKKRVKQRLSFLLRIFGALLLICGGIIPLVGELYSASLALWGYPVLALAGGILLLDRSLGLSSGWSRFIQAALAIEARTQVFKLKWGLICEYKCQNRSELYTLAIEFTQDINKIVELETGQWLIEHAKALSDLSTMSEKSK